MTSSFCDEVVGGGKEEREGFLEKAALGGIWQGRGESFPAEGRAGGSNIDMDEAWPQTGY